MSTKLTRWMGIIVTLQNRPGATARELAEKFEVDKRTIHRDIGDLNAAGIPIINEGRGKGYSFLSRIAMYPLDWTSEERQAFYALPAIIEKISGLIPNGALDAIQKVIVADNKKRDEDKRLTERLAKAIQVGNTSYINDKSAQLLSTILEAIYERKTIKTKYYTLSRKSWNTRKMDPYYLVPREHRFYVIAFCHKHKSFRTFRLSRFEHIEITHMHFNADDFDLVKYLKNTWSIIRGDKEIRFKVKFDEEIADYVLEEELFLTPKFKKNHDGTLIMEVTVNDDQEFLHWLSQYRYQAEILSPLSYRQKMRETLQSWLKRYEDSNRT